ncbi:MAG TPA: hypothetical protein VNA13_03755 [Xanthomonadales bacterium]|nr:hypothetical protein [Xanthomonadales bacterium]
MKKLLSIFLSTVSFIFFLPSVAFAADLCPPSFANLCKLQAGTAGGAVGNIVSVLIIIAIILSLIYLVYGGIKWITSGGDKAKVDAARSHITAAIIGVVIALLSYLILNVVVYVFTGQTFNSFKLPKLLD